jgi:signal transduction histidine kinase
VNTPVRWSSFPFWLPVLPIWASSLVLLGVLIRHSAPHALLPALSAAVAVGLGFLEGLLLSAGMRRRRELNEQVRRLEAIYEIIHKAGASLDLQEVLDAVTRFTVEVTAVRGCSIKLWDPDSGTMRVRSLAGIAREATDLSVDVAENIYHRSLMEGQAVLVGAALARDFPEVDDQTESLICVPLRTEGRTLGALCVYGERGRRLTESMISLYSTLGDLVTLSISNASVYENLKRLDEAKTWFLLKASHELRSPLDTIQSVSRTLTQGFLGELTQRQLDMVRRIELRAESLARSVDDLLVLARGRAETTLSELERLDFCALLSESVRFYHPVAKEKGVILEVECLPGAAEVYGRKDGLQSIISNLLSNAIKYTPPEGRVKIRLADADGRLLFEVADTGIGIPEEEQERLFSEFFRATNARELGQTGTGLGLTIVKATVEQHGGSIEVRSREGEGTVVRVFLNRVGK